MTDENLDLTPEEKAAWQGAEYIRVHPRGLETEDEFRERFLAAALEKTLAALRKAEFWGQLDPPPKSEQHKMRWTDADWRAEARKELGK